MFGQERSHTNHLGALAQELLKTEPTFYFDHQAKPSQAADLSQAEPSQAEPSRAKPSRVESSRAELGQAKPSQAADLSRAELSQADGWPGPEMRREPEMRQNEPKQVLKADIVTDPSRAELCQAEPS